MKNRPLVPVSTIQGIVRPYNSFAMLRRARNCRGIIIIIIIIIIIG